MHKSFYLTKDIQGTLEELEDLLKKVIEDKNECVANKKYEYAAKIRDIERQLIAEINRKKNIE